jgi:hypothetical protein
MSYLDVIQYYVRIILRHLQSMFPVLRRELLIVETLQNRVQDLEDTLNWIHTLYASDYAILVSKLNDKYSHLGISFHLNLEPIRNSYRKKHIRVVDATSEFMVAYEINRDTAYKLLDTKARTNRGLINHINKELQNND